LPRKFYFRIPLVSGEITAPALFWRLASDDPTPSFLEIWTTPHVSEPDNPPLLLGLKAANGTRIGQGDASDNRTCAPQWDVPHAAHRGQQQLANTAANCGRPNGG
jgi:hypothetical protein